MMKYYFVFTYDKYPDSIFESDELQEIIVEMLKLEGVEKIAWWNATTLMFYSSLTTDQFNAIFGEWRDEFYYLIAPINRTYIGPIFSTWFDKEKHVRFHNKYYGNTPLFYRGR